MSGPGKFLRPVLFISAVLLASFWHSWHWFWQRLSDQSDEPWGALALLTVLFLTACRHRSFALSNLPQTYIPLLALMALYASMYQYCPDIILAAVAVFAVAVVFSRIAWDCRMHAATFGLLLISLPIIPSLQFYFGYPLRVLVTWMCQLFLLLSGVRVAVDGCALRWCGEDIIIDAPCSGLKMLWFSAFLALTLANLYALKSKRTVILLGVSMTAALFANVWRAASLFLIESKILHAPYNLPLPDWTHAAIGGTIFALEALLIVGAAELLRRSEPKEVAVSSTTPPKVFAPHFTTTWRSAAALTALCLVAMTTQMNPSGGRIGRATAASAASWPETFEGRKLKPQSLSPSEEEFSKGFPGVMAKFNDGTRILLFRRVATATRQLHPSADCFRGAGYEIKPAPLRKDGDGTLWGCFTARKGSQDLLVHERIFDEQGHSYTDVSQWYWAALFNQTKGPWTAVTSAASKTNPS